jgi:general stress protein 26
MLTPDMIRLIQFHSAGMVATTTDDGLPAVSPKATFVVVDERTIAFGNIRSPGTVANIRKRPDVEINFLDVLERKAVRVRGTAQVVSKPEAVPRVAAAFEKSWADYLDQMSSFVVINITRATMILSPAYDLGHTADELRASNLARLNKL